VCGIHKVRGIDGKIWYMFSLGLSNVVLFLIVFMYEVKDTIMFIY
jgi:hypothetical protein